MDLHRAFDAVQWELAFEIMGWMEVRVAHVRMVEATHREDVDLHIGTVY